MNLIFTAILLGLLAFFTGLIFIPFIRKVATYFNLVDKPNYRKVHTTPIPLIGGISIFIVSFIILLFSGQLMPILDKYWPILSAALLLLLVGVIDDKVDLNAKYKLVIQLLLALSIAFSGTRLTSFYGIFGIYELGIYMQYALTIVVITGVVNAFNLMDGVDGLVGSLSFLGFSMLLFASFFYQNNALLLLSVVCMGAVSSFLRFNLSQKRKIFMGDSGSLFLGFTLVSLGINLLQSKVIDKNQNHSFTFLILVSFFTIPVLDSLRVYLGRLKNGNSPFKADKSHLHHLLLNIGASHKKIALYLTAMCLIMFFVVFGLISYFSITLIVLSLVSFFSVVIKSLLAVNSLKSWKIKITQMENM